MYPHNDLFINHIIYFNTTQHTWDDTPSLNKNPPETRPAVTIRVKPVTGVMSLVSSTHTILRPASEDAVLLVSMGW